MVTAPRRSSRLISRTVKSSAVSTAPSSELWAASAVPEQTLLGGCLGEPPGDAADQNAEASLSASISAIITATHENVASASPVDARVCTRCQVCLHAATEGPLCNRCKSSFAARHLKADCHEILLDIEELDSECMKLGVQDYRKTGRPNKQQLEQEGLQVMPVTAPEHEGMQAGCTAACSVPCSICGRGMTRRGNVCNSCYFKCKTLKNKQEAMEQLREEILIRRRALNGVSKQLHEELSARCKVPKGVSKRQKTAKSAAVGAMIDQVRDLRYLLGLDRRKVQRVLKWVESFVQPLGDLAHQGHQPPAVQQGGLAQLQGGGPDAVSTKTAAQRQGCQEEPVKGSPKLQIDPLQPQPPEVKPASKECTGDTQRKPSELKAGSGGGPEQHGMVEQQGNGQAGQSHDDPELCLDPPRPEPADPSQPRLVAHGQEEMSPEAKPAEQGARVMSLRRNSCGDVMLHCRGAPRLVRTPTDTRAAESSSNRNAPEGSPGFSFGAAPQDNPTPERMREHKLCGCPLELEQQPAHDEGHGVQQHQQTPHVHGFKLHEHGAPEQATQPNASQSLHLTPLHQDPEMPGMQPAGAQVVTTLAAGSQDDTSPPEVGPVQGADVGPCNLGNNVLKFRRRELTSLLKSPTDTLSAKSPPLASPPEGGSALSFCADRPTPEQLASLQNGVAAEPPVSSVAEGHVKPRSTPSNARPCPVHTRQGGQQGHEAYGVAGQQSTGEQKGASSANVSFMGRGCRNVVYSFGYQTADLHGGEQGRNGGGPTISSDVRKSQSRCSQNLSGGTSPFSFRLVHADGASPTAPFHVGQKVAQKNTASDLQADKDASTAAPGGRPESVQSTPMKAFNEVPTMAGQVAYKDIFMKASKGVHRTMRGAHAVINNIIDHFVELMMPDGLGSASLPKAKYNITRYFTGLKNNVLGRGSNFHVVEIDSVSRSYAVRLSNRPSSTSRYAAFQPPLIVCLKSMLVPLVHTARAAEVDACLNAESLAPVMWDPATKTYHLLCGADGDGDEVSRAEKVWGALESGDMELATVEVKGMDSIDALERFEMMGLSPQRSFYFMGRELAQCFEALDMAKLQHPDIKAANSIVYGADTMPTMPVTLYQQEVHLSRVKGRLCDTGDVNNAHRKVPDYPATTYSAERRAKPCYTVGSPNSNTPVLMSPQQQRNYSSGDSEQDAGGEQKWRTGNLLRSFVHKREAPFLWLGDGRQEESVQPHQRIENVAQRQPTTVTAKGPCLERRADQRQSRGVIAGGLQPAGNTADELRLEENVHWPPTDVQPAEQQPLEPWEFGESANPHRARVYGLMPSALLAELGQLLMRHLQHDPMLRTCDTSQLSAVMDTMYRQSTAQSLGLQSFQVLEESQAWVDVVLGAIEDLKRCIAGQDRYARSKVEGYIDLLGVVMDAIICKVDMEGSAQLDRLIALLVRASAACEDIKHEAQAGSERLGEPDSGGDLTVFERIRLGNDGRNVMHAAMAAGKVSLVHTVIIECEREEIADKLPGMLPRMFALVDKGGDTPLSLALAKRRLTCVGRVLNNKSLLVSDTHNCLKHKDKEGRTFLHANARWKLDDMYEGSAAGFQLWYGPMLPWRSGTATLETIRAKLDGALADYEGEIDWEHVFVADDPFNFGAEDNRDLQMELMSGIESYVSAAFLFGKTEVGRDTGAGGDTPLHLAAALGNFAAIKNMICLWGADALECLDAENSAGRTPAEEARFCHPLTTSEKGLQLLKNYTGHLPVRRNRPPSAAPEPGEVKGADLYDAHEELRAWVMASLKPGGLSAEDKVRFFTEGAKDAT